MYNILTYEGLQVYDEKIKDFTAEKGDEWLTEEEVLSIINGVDLNDNYIEFEISETRSNTVTKRAYRYPNGDIAGTNNVRTLCFSEIDSTRYYVVYNGSKGPWSDTGSTLIIGSTVYSDSARTTSISVICGGSEGFIVSGLTDVIVYIDGVEVCLDSNKTFAEQGYYEIYDGDVIEYDSFTETEADYNLSGVWPVNNENYSTHITPFPPILKRTFIRYSQPETDTQYHIFKLFGNDVIELERNFNMVLFCDERIFGGDSGSPTLIGITGVFDYNHLVMYVPDSTLTFIEICMEEGEPKISKTFNIDIQDISYDGFDITGEIE